MLCANVGSLNLSDSTDHHGDFAQAMPISSTPMKTPPGLFTNASALSQAQQAAAVGFGVSAALSTLNSIVFGAQAVFNGPSNLFVPNNNRFGTNAITFNPFIPPNSIGALLDANNSSGVKNEDDANGIQHAFITANDGVLNNQPNSSRIKTEESTTVEEEGAVGGIQRTLGVGDEDFVELKVFKKGN